MNGHSPGINHTMYSSYLNEHLLGSEGGIHAFKAAARTWEGTAAERQLNSLSRQVSEDHADLCKIMRTLDYRSHPVKHLLTQGVRLVGRVNPVNILRQQKAGMTQIELDILMGMVRAKKAMWETLLMVATRDKRLDVPLLQDLSNRADCQIDQVRGIISHSWEERFYHAD